MSVGTAAAAIRSSLKQHTTAISNDHHSILAVGLSSNLNDSTSSSSSGHSSCTSTALAVTPSSSATTAAPALPAFAAAAAVAAAAVVQPLFATPFHPHHHHHHHHSQQQNNYSQYSNQYSSQQQYPSQVVAAAVHQHQQHYNGYLNYPSTPQHNNTTDSFSRYAAAQTQQLQKQHTSDHALRANQNPLSQHSAAGDQQPPAIVVRDMQKPNKGSTHKHAKLDDSSRGGEFTRPSNGANPRKRRRGVIEKKRRDRINTSLTELRRLVPAAFEKQGSHKLEKAEILQLTVEHLRALQSKGYDQSSDPRMLDYHNMGFRECVAEVTRFLTQQADMDANNPLRARLMGHLHCFAANRDQMKLQQHNNVSSSATAAAAVVQQAATWAAHQQAQQASAYTQQAYSTYHQQHQFAAAAAGVATNGYGTNNSGAEVATHTAGSTTALAGTDHSLCAASAVTNGFSFVNGNSALPHLAPHTPQHQGMSSAFYPAAAAAASLVGVPQHHQQHPNQVSSSDYVVAANSNNAQNTNAAAVYARAWKSEVAGF